MSHENVEIARRVYARLFAGDLLRATPEQIDRIFREDLDEHFEFRPPSDYPEGEVVFRGRDGIDRLIDRLREAWGEWRFEPERFLDAGDRVVVLARITGEGDSSGAPFELENAHVITIRAGRATAVYAYRDRGEALEAAGLSE